MKAELIITNYNSKETYFLLEEGRLVRACLLHNGSLIGNIYVAKVVNIVKSINAAFVDAGTGDYLYYPLADNEARTIFTRHGNSNKVCPGDDILIQISRDPIKTKKGEASSDIVLKGDYVIINRTGEVGISSKITDVNERENLKSLISGVLGDFKDLKAGVIVRTAAKGVSEDIIREEAHKILCKLRDIIDKSIHINTRTLVKRNENDYINYIKEILVKDKYEEFEIITDLENVFDEIRSEINNMDLPGGYDPERKINIKLFSDNMTNPTLVYNLKSKLEKGMARTVHLKSGGSIVVDVTEAMTVIDVNTGKAIRGKNSEKTFLKINKEAAETIATVLRLRNLSGIIIIDFINMKDQDANHELIEYLKACLAKDEVRVNYVDITGLGLIELTRRKQAQPVTLADFN